MAKGGRCDQPPLIPIRVGVGLVDRLVERLAGVRHVATDALDGLATGENERGQQEKNNLAHHAYPLNNARARARRTISAPVLGRAFTLQPLADQLAGAADGFSLLPGALFRGLLVKLPALHLAEGSLPLHLFLQRAQRLFDVVVADNDLDQRWPP